MDELSRCVFVTWSVILDSKGAYHLHEKTAKFQLENQMVPIIPFGVLLKLWASGKSDVFLLYSFWDLQLMFIHYCMLLPSVQDKLNHFVFMPKIFIRVVCVNGKHPGALPFAR